MIRFFSYLLAAACIAVPLSASAAPHDARIKDVIESQVRKWLADPVVIEAIKAQNGKHQGLSQDEIIRMDKTWRQETQSGARPFIDAVLANELSRHLRAMKDSADGLFTEIFVMDNKGLNVGQSDVTSDYWQGDEAKWKNSFLAGPHAVFIDEVEFDESTQQYQVQVSVAIDEGGSAIGAATIGMNVELLE